jgi:hypothetical protein
MLRLSRRKLLLPRRQFIRGTTAALICAPTIARAQFSGGFGGAAGFSGGMGGDGGFSRGGGVGGGAVTLDALGTVQLVNSAPFDYTGLTSNSVSNQAIIVGWVCDNTGSDGQNQTVSMVYDPAGVNTSMTKIKGQPCATGTGVILHGSA